MSDKLIEKEILIQRLVTQIQLLSKSLDDNKNVATLIEQLEKEREEYDKLILEHFKDRI